MQNKTEEEIKNWKNVLSYCGIDEFYHGEAIKKLSKEYILQNKVIGSGEGEKIYLHDPIDGEFEEMESRADCEQYVRDNYMEGGEVHIDIEGIVFLKKIGCVVVTDLGETVELNGEQVPHVKVAFEWETQSSKAIGEEDKGK